VAFDSGPPQRGGGGVSRWLYAGLGLAPVERMLKGSRRTRRRTPVWKSKSTVDGVTAKVQAHGTESLHS